ncbi:MULTISPECIES: hypothetical protein [unclassified Polaribacter]|uniref:hypothetical protein n=1 Tax=unclassified Polaribacter TaxID=196858 RepID=UPI0011BEB9D9|nr:MULTISPECIES: hypothetical protein [unclassified Polaribacter]TXD52059.1 hypothetical protein ES043_09440 [Polaribacter sp. IC063]TXD59781.1 hypothetical protein ES044_08930 [Polaribacter sp. IC066]
MKNTIYFLSILILFQSCYSYKTFKIENHGYTASNSIKIQLKNSKKYKGDVIEYKDDKLTLETWNEFVIIPFSEIKKIKERKKSNLKTQLLIRGLGTVIILALFYLLLTRI